MDRQHGLLKEVETLIQNNKVQQRQINTLSVKLAALQNKTRGALTSMNWRDRLKFVFTGKLSTFLTETDRALLLDEED